MNNCSPGAGNGLPIEASGVPLCTRLEVVGTRQIFSIYQLLGLNLGGSMRDPPARVAYSGLLIL